MRVKRLRLILGAAVSAALAVVDPCGRHGRLAFGSDREFRRAARPTTMRSPSFGGGGGSAHRAAPAAVEGPLRQQRSATMIRRGNGKGDGRRRPTKRPIHVGPIIGTGVAIGTLGPAGAGTGAGPSGSPPSGGASRGGHLSAARRRGSLRQGRGVAGVRRPVPRAASRTWLRAAPAWSSLSRNSSRSPTRPSCAPASPTDARCAPCCKASSARRRCAPASRTCCSWASQSQSVAAPEAAKLTPAVAAAAAIPAGGDPAQYVLAKLHLGEAHTLANGDRVLVAVIDSGIDIGSSRSCRRLRRLLRRDRQGRRRRTCTAPRSPARSSLMPG